MSAVTATGASHGIYSLINKAAVGRVSTASTSNTGSGPSIQAPGGRHHGRHHGGAGGGAGGALFKQIQSAVSDALSAAQGNPSADPNTTIENAIAKVFKDSGITPPTAPPEDGKTRIPLSATGPKDANGDRDGRNKVAGSNVAAGGPNSARAAFFNTLKQYGVNPQQFRQDFLAAVKDAQNGTVKGSTALASLPTGLTVDTTA